MKNVIYSSLQYSSVHISNENEPSFTFDQSATKFVSIKKSIWKPKSSGLYLRKKFREISLFFTTFFFLLCSFPVFASAAPSFTVSQCMGSTCSPVDQIRAGAGETITLRIGIKNPETTSIYSVTSWFQYNPQVIEVVSLSDDSSDFELEAPGEFKAKNDTGEIRIGRAVSGTPITSASAVVADITLMLKKDPSGASLSWKEFLSNDIGKTAIVGLNSGMPANILASAPKNISFISSSSANTNSTVNFGVNSGSSNSTINAGYGVQNPSTFTNTSGNTAGSANGNNKNANQTQLQNPTMNFVSIARPTGLRSRTNPEGSMEHLWQMGTDSRIAGYYVYYSTSSGTYMHRRDVGKTNILSFPAGFFEKGKRVYFSVQAYTTGKEVSDFSDETYSVVGTVGSESHPFFEQIFPNAQISGSDNRGIYYQTQQTNGSISASMGENTANTSLSKPSTHTQSGLSIPTYIYFLFAGLAFLFARRLLRY